MVNCRIKPAAPETLRVCDAGGKSSTRLVVESIMTKKWIFYVLFAILFILIGWSLNLLFFAPRHSNPVAQIVPKPLDKYTIENLAKAKVPTGEIELGKVLDDTQTFTSYEFFHYLDPTLTGKPAKKTSGVINIPKGAGPFPIIAMIRGYVDKEKYTLGEGTQHGAELFASKGFITIAPDFLGYGDSDPEPNSTFEARFQTYTTVMSLMASLPSVSKWDKKNTFIWAHSNGGQIALTVLEITGKEYPTVLWAPVSKPFPYSILYYTDDSPDLGKYLRLEIANFERTYDVNLYSIHQYYERIKAPIELDQGTADESVPQKWSDELSKTLKDNGIDTAYRLYPASDHNMLPLWNLAISNDLIFYNLHLTK